MEGIKRDILKVANLNMVNKLIVLISSLTIILLVLKSLIPSIGNSVKISDFILFSSYPVFKFNYFWTFLSSLFFAGYIYELIWMMLLLYWFGNILGDLLGDMTILPAYLFTGIIGSILFYIFIYFSGVQYQYFSGVGSATIGIITASAFIAPDYNLRIVLVGKIAIKYLVLAIISINIVYLIAVNDLKYISYCGSILASWYFIYDIRHGRNIQKGFNKFFDRIVFIFGFLKFKKESKLKVTYKSRRLNEINRNDSKPSETKLNHILEKINNLGYDNLTRDEKEFLFKSSREL